MSRCIHTETRAKNNLVFIAGIDYETADDERFSMTSATQDPDVQSKAKILIVDDEDAMRMVESTVLEELGHEIFQASSGSQALALAFEKRPDLVLLDLKMPGMSGIEVCQQLRADERTQHIGIIVISGLEAKVALEESIIAGADDFLQKPFEGMELLVRVRSMLRVLNIHDPGKRVEAYIRSLHALRAQNPS